MEGQYPEEMKCPICFEIPVNEIFQCKNGHMICSNCSNSLTSCPQCRTSYEANKIRNRPLENLLDLMKFDCTYKSHGCTKKISRREISNHVENCTFGGIDLCQILGYSCEFRFTPKKLQEGIKHFEQCHGFIVCRKLQIGISLEGILDFRQSCRSFWTPVIFDLNGFTGMFLCMFNSEDNTLSPVWVQLDEDNCVPVNSNGYQVNLKIKAFGDSTLPDIHWTSLCVNIKHVSFLIKQPSCGFRFDTLKSFYVNHRSLLIHCSLTSAISSVSSKAGEFETIYVLNVSNFEMNDSRAKISSATQGEGQIRRFQIRQSIFLPEPNINEVTPLSEHETVIFVDTVCDVCQRTPVIERYKCLQCDNFDLCGTCMMKKEHSHHTFALIRNIKQQTRLHRKLISRSGAWKPFISSSTSIDDYFTNGQRDMFKAHCCKCSDAGFYVCLLCTPIKAYCQNCFEQESRNHDDEHFFAVANSTRKMHIVIESILQQ